MQAEAKAHDRDSKERLLAGLLLFLAAAVACSWFVFTRGLCSGTGYLHLLFARSLAETGVYGAGAGATLGDGSPVWLALLALMHTFDGGGGWVNAGRVLGAFAAVFALAGTYRFARALGEAQPGRGTALLPAWAVLAVVASPFWPLAAFAGENAVFAAGLLCWGLAMVSGPLRRPLAPWKLLTACLCAGLAPLVRPELLLFSLCLGPLGFVRWVNTPMRTRTKVATFFGGLLLAVGPGAAWLLWTVRQFGTALPHTLAASRAAPTASVSSTLLADLLLGGPLVAVAGTALLFLGGRRALERRQKSGLLEPAATERRATGHPATEPVGALDVSGWAALVWAALTVLWYLGLHLEVGPGEVLLLVPAAGVSLLAGLAAWKPAWWQPAAALAVVLGLGLSSVAGIRLVHGAAERQTMLATLAAVVRGLPPTEPVALAPAAEVLFLARHPVVDLSGALLPAAAAFRWDSADNRRVWWAHGQGARYMLLDHSPEPGSQAVWTSGKGTGGSGNHGRGRGSAPLTLWRLPPSPTLPEPLNLLPTGD